MKVTAVLVAFVLAATVLTGCGNAQQSPQQTSQQSATFVVYETKVTSTDTQPSALFGTITKEVKEPTGKAMVTLGDGTDLLANCPIQGLSKGDEVTVQQNGDGTWVVLGNR